MQQQPLNALLQDLEQELLRLGYTEGSMIQVNQIRVERKEPFAIYSEHHLTRGD